MKLCWPLFISLTTIGACGEEESVNLDPVTRHACIHAEHGPFEMVSAGSSPDLSAAHTAFVVDLDSSGTLRYQPRETAGHVFYTNTSLQWTLFQGDEEMSPFSVQKTSELCEYLSDAHAYDLSADATYTIMLEEGEIDEVTFIIEAVDG